MASHEKRLTDMEVRWRRPPSWKVWFAEETADGQMIEVWTGESVVPGPNDTVVVIRECPPAKRGLADRQGDVPAEDF